MNTFTFIILIAFIGLLAGQFVVAIERNCLSLTAMFGLEIMAFAYLAYVLI